MLAGSALLTLTDAITKVFAHDLPVGEILVVRSAFSLAPIAVLVARARTLESLRMRDRRGQAARAILMLVSTFCFVTGLAYLPLADNLAITFAGPLFVTALAPLMLAERVGWRRWAAVVVGFVGVLVITAPTGGGAQWAALFPLAAALAATLRDIVTRRMRGTDTAASMLLYSALALILGGLATSPFGWRAMGAFEIGLLAVGGMVQGVGHMLVIEAFRSAEAALVVPFKYTVVLWAALYGYLIFGDVPGANVVSGTAIVLAAGLYIYHREIVVSRRRRAGEGPSDARSR